VLSLEEAASRLAPDQMLGRTLRDLSSKADMGMTPDKSARLTRARLARNYIAHKGAAAVGDLYGYNVQKMLDALRALQSNVRDLAAGDNLVSEWIFQIEEPREQAPSVREAYLELVDDWIFGHMPENWLNVNWRAEHQPPRTLRDAIAAATAYRPWYSRDDSFLHDADEAARRRQLIERNTLRGDD
jgi:hypothetical protein